jgi:hypothetical protein
MCHSVPPSSQLSIPALQKLPLPEYLRVQHHAVTAVFTLEPCQKIGRVLLQSVQTWWHFILGAAAAAAYGNFFSQQLIANSWQTC